MPILDHFGAITGPRLAILEPFWGHLGAIFGHLGTNTNRKPERQQIDTPRPPFPRADRSHSLPCWAILGQTWGNVWAILEPRRAKLFFSKPSRGYLWLIRTRRNDSAKLARRLGESAFSRVREAILGPSWGNLGPFWASLKASSAMLGSSRVYLASCGHLRTILRPS